jgi:hypothetical protein
MTSNNFETLLVDGVERSKTDATGRPLGKSDQEVDDFWRWFGGSIAVDGVGRPVPVFHGTNAAFDSFDESYLGFSTYHQTAKLGFYFSPTVAGAKAYAGRAGQEGRVIIAYLRMENPDYLTWNTMPTSSEESMRLKNDLVSKGVDGLIVDSDDIIYATEVVAFRSDQIWISADLKYDYAPRRSPRP